MRPLWGLGKAYDVHLRLIGKLVVDFLLVIIELFSLALMVVELRPNIRFEMAILQRGESLWFKIPVEGDIPHQPFVHE